MKRPHGNRDIRHARARRLPAIVLGLAAGLAGAAMAQQSYDPMARPGRGFDPLAPRAAPRAPEKDVELDPELGNLPAGEGAELVYYICSGCHSLDIVRQQRLTDARWAYTLDWMVEEQDMAELDPQTEATVLGYLQRHFSSQR